MVQHLRCPRGHCWEAAVDQPAEAATVLLACPVCGAVGQSVAGHAAQEQASPANGVDAYAETIAPAKVSAVGGTAPEVKRSAGSRSQAPPAPDIYLTAETLAPSHSAAPATPGGAG